MNKLTQNQQNILTILLKKDGFSSSIIHEALVTIGTDIALVTVKRELSLMKSLNFIESIGAGRSVVYIVSPLGRLVSDINSTNYCLAEPDKRYGQANYNFNLFDAISTVLFTNEEEKLLTEATIKYSERTRDLSETIREKELARFIIELSWKSSKIEGNTYTLLDTEKLILEGIEAKGHDRKETQMILNHKEAFKFILENINSFKEINKVSIEEVHKILVKDLNVNIGLRSKPVGVTGSIYKPLDNIHQVSEAVLALTKAISKTDNPYFKALLAIVGISYIQPFEDGNKRTSRLIGNAILLAHKCAPLSYRSVDENIYREAMLVFYELNSLVPFKKIFIEQYVFSAENYLIN